MIGWGERLRQCHPGKTQLAWCAEVGISHSIWIDYIKERRSPTLETLLHSGRSIHWIATGDEFPAGVDYDVLAGCIEAVQSEVPNIDAESKAKLTVVLYKDRIKNVQNETKGNQAKSNSSAA
jgi:hypothetical protein